MNSEFLKFGIFHSQNPIGSVLIHTTILQRLTMNSVRKIPLISNDYFLFFFFVEDIKNENGIRIENLSKYYGNKMALKNLSINFDRNMITAFLGRNGAGKSTTWSIITGLIPPSSGTVYVDGYNILKDIQIIRRRLGFVPQYNTLFDLLTVKEHLQFFAR